MNYLYEELLRSLLLENGHKISKVSKMTDTELNTALDLIESSENQNIKIKYYLSNFIISGINFDEYKFNTLFNNALKEFDFVTFY